MKEITGNPVVKEIVSWLQVIAAAVLIAFFIDNVIIVNASVPSGSMENTIMTNSRLLGSRLSYYFGDPKRGDIVVFRYPVAKAMTAKERKENGVHTLYVKRIIGLPGETVEIRDAKIYIDGSDTPLPEDYLPEEWTERNTNLTYRVPEGCYFLLGDNRNSSADSRYWAEEALFYGVADNAADAERFRFVPRKDITGKVSICYWPLTRIGYLY